MRGAQASTESKVFIPARTGFISMPWFSAAGSVQMHLNSF